MVQVVYNESQEKSGMSNSKNEKEEEVEKAET